MVGLVISSIAAGFMAGIAGGMWLGTLLEKWVQKS